MIEREEISRGMLADKSMRTAASLGRAPSTVSLSGDNYFCQRIASPKNVAVARPARLFAEQRVLRDALRSPVTVLQLPRTQQLVKILRGQALEIFLHEERGAAG